MSLTLHPRFPLLTKYHNNAVVIPVALLKALNLTLLALACAGQSSAASFDCTRATQPIEKQICSSERLSALDDAMAAEYTRVQHFHPDPDRLRTEQRIWLRTRNACPDDGCRIDAYEIRIDALKATTSTGTGTVMLPKH